MSATNLKLAQIMAGAATGGAEVFFERMTTALAAAGDDVLAVIRRNQARAARLRQAGLQPVELGFGGKLDWLTGPRLAATLRRFGPRVVVAWMSRAASFAPRGDWVLVGRFGGYYDVGYYRHCDHLVANTRGLVGWITGQGWPAPRAHYLPNFSPDLAGAAALARNAVGVPAEGKLVLALGRLHRNKAFDVLVRAMPRLPGVQVVIAGEGPERAALVDLARRERVADRLHLPGWRTDTAALLAMADLLVCPSRQEPLGNVVIEAWSAHRPVVAAAADGPCELIVPGRDGLLVPTEDAVALATAICSVLEDPARSAALVAAGRSRYECDFAEAPVVALWQQFLTTVEKA